MPANISRVSLLLCMASALAAVAQQPKLNQESLLIGRGDLLSIHIVETPELEQHPRVEDSGKIPPEWLPSP